ISGLREKELIRDSFGKYVTKQVVDELLQGRLKLGGERVDVTILFSDIRGFTSISEKEKPEEVVKLLNEYFTMMVNTIIRYEGTIDKFIGDGILTIFGAPIRHKDHAQRAIDAAIAMQDELVIFNRLREKEGKTPIRVGMAINTGEAIVGNIGSELKMEYTVIGDTVNVASRVEELNKQFGTEILITHNVYTNATKSLNVKKLTPTALRGRKDLIQLYELKGTNISNK
ncbi:MAG: adenylate/guanylate cyclase domain-containing protein, partial [Methanosarcinales archaeon]